MTNIDPMGDELLTAIVIGAGIAGFTNALSQTLSNGGYWDWGEFGLSVGLGALGGAASFGIGQGADALIRTTNLSCSAVCGLQAVGHGLSGGLASLASGDNFGSGALSGALSSGISSGASALGIGDLGMIGIGGLTGGLGSVIGGGNFWQGVGQGLITSGLNHAAHEAVKDSGWPPGADRLIRMRDAEHLAEITGGNVDEIYWQLLGLEGDAAMNAAIMAMSLSPAGGVRLTTTQLGTRMFNSKSLGYRSWLFGRQNSFLPNGTKGLLNNNNYLRIGWGAHSGRHVFRLGIGSKNFRIHQHYDLILGPKW